MAPPDVSESGELPMPGFRPERPCDSCRRRKTRCVVNAGSPSCVLCEFHKYDCTFLEDAAPRRRKAPASEQRPLRKRLKSNRVSSRPISDSSSRTRAAVDDYANLAGESLLKETLGLQHNRHAKYVGPTSEHDVSLLDFQVYGGADNDNVNEHGVFRKVGLYEFFQQFVDSDEPNHAAEVEDLDQIEKLVDPHGEALIRLYFRIVHPSFPILHKKVYLEKYGRSHREFSPPLLAAVYILALNWWSYSLELAKQTKPDVLELERLAFRTLQDVSHRAKLSTVQAGLLLLQRPTSSQTWQLTSQLVAIGQDLGLHQDCTHWRIPSWERGLRKRLAWALFMQDTWAALIYGRPPHISLSNWAVQPVTSADFPENAADENEEEGSTEVEKGRALFSAMITLTKMLSEVLDRLYSLKSDADIKNSSDSTKAVLERAKPIQLKLRSWYADMPETLRIDTVKVGKLSSVGYLHLAYFGVEITLHRCIVRALSPNTDPYMIQICRSAAKTRLISATDTFNKLKPEHLQSFWYFASKFTVALIGTFAGLCLVTSISQDEAEFYRQRLQEFRWTLRVSSKSSEFLEAANSILEPAVSGLLKATDKADNRSFSFPLLQEPAEDEHLRDAFFTTTEGLYSTPPENYD